jgi:2-polyprenyl-3-methyl-5-hydroxy-6-metoxy-1,4-benzoquinol methylase
VSHQRPRNAISTQLDRLRARRASDVHLRSAPQLLQYKSIARRIAGDRPANVLDWGCGFGQVSQLLREEGLDVTPMDYAEDVTPGMYPLERYPGLEAYLTPEPVALPFDEGSFDAVLSCGVLEHVPDPDGSVEEIHRVLRPGGRFYVYNLPNRWSYLEKVGKAAGLHYHGVDPYDKLYSRTTATALLTRHGFDVVEFRRANLLPLSLSGPVATRAAGAIWHTSRALQRVPGLNLIATSLELVGVARRDHR